MSARAARAIRRDLRRTVGEDGIEALTATTNALNNSVFPNLNAVQARTAGLDERVKRLESEAIEAAQQFGEHLVTAIETQQDILHTQRLLAAVMAAPAVRADSFWQRLRWLVLGR